MSLLVICGILGVHVNTLAVNDKYFLCNSENFRQPIQMQLSKKQKTSFSFFASFRKSTSNIKHFEEKDDPHSLGISEITDCERLG